MKFALVDNDSRVGEWLARTICSEIRIGQVRYVRNPSLDTLTASSFMFVLLADDSPSSEFEQPILNRCREEGIPMLLVQGRGSTVLVSPLETPGTPGCITCAHLRFEHSTRRLRANRLLQQQFGDLNKVRLPLNFTGNQLELLARRIVSELLQVIQGRTEVLSGHVGLYRTTGDLEWAPLVPSHDCPRCGLRIQDGPELGQFHYESHSVQDIQALRVREIDYRRLRHHYVHEDIGYISEVHTRYDENHEYVVASAVHKSPSLDVQVGYGSSYQDFYAEQAAVLEVLERTCVAEATGRRPSIMATYQSVRLDALDPRTLGLHAEDIYQMYDNFRRFDERHEYSWIWAYSSLGDKPILVPEQVAYYGRTRDKKRFVKESSNGCALGSTLEEAVLHGIFEVLERDGLMNMWYGEMPVPELSFSSDCPDSLDRIVTLLKNRNFTVRLFDISHDLEVPSVLAVAMNQQDNAPRVFCGSASHVNPYQAASSALRELIVQMMHLTGLSDKRINQGREMVKDASKIVDVLDHIVAAATPEAYPRWKFLLEGDRDAPLTLKEAYVDVQRKFRVESQDIKIILEAVIDDLHHRGFDVIVVDQTNAEAAYGGFRAVKVIIPGMTPVAFGHRFERFEGLTRVYELPYKMGYRSHVLTRDELNPYCHPLS